MKISIIFWLAVFLITTAPAQASKNHTTTNNYYESSGPATTSTNVTNLSTGTSKTDLDLGIAKALSCDQSWYMGTGRLQLGIQGAVYHGESALCIGVGQVVGDDKDVMLNFSVVPDDQDNPSDWGYQGGVMFLF